MPACLPCVACLLDPPQKKHLGFQNNGEKGVVVYLPPGRFKITQSLEISQSNVVLRGAGVRLWTQVAPLWRPAVAGGGGGRERDAGRQQEARIADQRGAPSAAPRQPALLCQNSVLPSPPSLGQAARTTLWMPKGLQAIYGNRDTWATGGAFLM